MVERSSGEVRAAEVIATACLATDLGMGFPFEHGLHATLATMRLADLLGVDSETASQCYYVSLLMYSGCTTDSDISTGIFAGNRTDNITPVQFGSRFQAVSGALRALPPPDSGLLRRTFEVARRAPSAARFPVGHFAALCEVAEELARRMGLPPSIHRLFTNLTERWDGKSMLRRADGDAIPLPLRIVQVARDAAYQRLIGGDEAAVNVIRERAGHAFDPDIAAQFVDRADEILTSVDVVESAWDATLSAEPRPWATLDGDQVDAALAAIGDFADLAAPSLSGHSAGVADLVAIAARRCGFDPEQEEAVIRAAHVHDVGRVATSPRIWQRERPLSADEWEQARLHPYHTERILSRSPFLRSLAEVACAHHERLDGTGYHRGVSSASLAPAARLLAAADAFHAMTEPRPHREPMLPAEAARELEREANGGRMDPEMVAAVVEAAGEPALPVERPAGLTEREAEVIGLIARGLQTKQVGRALDISAKTADRHIQNAYRKIGVSTRAGATLFAMEHGLVSWGELPTSRPRETT